MSRDERERLHDIVEALEMIRDYVGGSLEEPSIDARSSSTRSCSG